MTASCRVCPNLAVRESDHDGPWHRAARPLLQARPAARRRRWSVDDVLTALGVLLVVVLFAYIGIHVAAAIAMGRIP